MSKLINKLMDNAGLSVDEEVRNNDELLKLAKELSRKGVNTVRDGNDMILSHDTFFIAGSYFNVGLLLTLKKDLIINLVNLKNINCFYFGINADSGTVDIGFNLSHLIKGESPYNMRFVKDIDWLRAMLINTEGDGSVFRLNWFDNITPDVYSTINDEDSLLSVAFNILEDKANEILEKENNNNE